MWGNGLSFILPPFLFVHAAALIFFANEAYKNQEASIYKKKIIPDLYCLQASGPILLSYTGKFNRKSRTLKL